MGLGRGHLLTHASRRRSHGWGVVALILVQTTPLLFFFSFLAFSSFFTSSYFLAWIRALGQAFWKESDWYGWICTFSGFPSFSRPRRCTVECLVPLDLCRLYWTIFDRSQPLHFDSPRETIYVLAPEGSRCTTR